MTAATVKKGSTVYLNWKGPAGLETVDELSESDFATYREFCAERKRLINEYALAGMDVYRSSRACKAWKDK